jgi:hypothetical protein
VNGYNNDQATELPDTDEPLLAVVLALIGRRQAAEFSL